MQQVPAGVAAEPAPASQVRLPRCRSTVCQSHARARPRVQAASVPAAARRRPVVAAAPLLQPPTRSGGGWRGSVMCDPTTPPTVWWSQSRSFSPSFAHRSSIWRSCRAGAARSRPASRSCSRCLRGRRWPATWRSHRWAGQAAVQAAAAGVCGPTRALRIRHAGRRARRACTPSHPAAASPLPPSPHPLQVWTYLPVLTEGRQVLKAEQLCLLGDAQLQGFHEGCAAEGVTVKCAHQHKMCIRFVVKLLARRTASRAWRPAQNAAPAGSSSSASTARQLTQPACPPSPCAFPPAASWAPWARCGRTALSRWCSARRASAARCTHATACQVRRTGVTRGPEAEGGAGWGATDGVAACFAALPAAGTRPTLPGVLRGVAACHLSCADRAPPPAC